MELPKPKILEAYGNAPQDVRDVFNADSTTNSITEIRNKYKLHVDATGTLGKDVGYMLLGLLSPQDFYEEIQKNGCDAATARQIMDDLNRDIFIPLHEKMTGSTAMPVVTTVRAPSYSPAPAPAISEFDKPVEPIVSDHVTPIAPVTAPAPAPINTVRPPVSTFATPITAPEAPAAPTEADANREALGKILKEYGVDPYREPVDEK